MITAIVGSVGGTTHSKNRYGFYIKNKPIPTNPNSPAQADQRAWMMQCVAGWKGTLTAAMAASWEHAGDLHKRSKYGQGFSLSGFNLFCGVNTLQLKAGGIIGTTATWLKGAPPVHIPTVDADIAGKLQASAWGETDVTMSAYLYATDAVAQTISYRNRPFVSANLLTVGAAFPIAIDVVYPGSGELYRVFFGLRTWNRFGGLSELIEFYIDETIV